MLSTIFGGNTGVTYEELQARKKLRDTLMAQAGRGANTFGGGLANFGAGIAGGIVGRMAKNEERDMNEYARERLMAFMGGGMPKADAPPHWAGPVVGNKVAPPAGATPPPAGGATPDGALYGLLKRTEGGGKYDTLFGYANRPGGQFAGVDVTKMTLDELAKFTDPSGPYGQYVKGKVGHVATPLGAGQIVGTTLRNAAKALGLPGDTVFSPEIQNRLIGYLAKSALAGAGTPEEKRARLRSTWAGFKSASDAEVDAAVAEIEGGNLGAPVGAATPPAGATPPATPDPMAGNNRLNMLMMYAADPRLPPHYRQMFGSMLAAEMARSAPMDPYKAAQLRNEDERIRLQREAAARAAAADDRDFSLRREELDRKRTDATAKAENEAKGENFERANKLRDDFNNEKEVKYFFEVKNSADRMASLAKTKDGISDYALTVAFAKMIDPGSVAREGEVAAVAGASSFTSALIQQYINEIQRGGKLPPEVRDAILRESNNFAAAAHRDYMRVYDQYKDRAGRFGVNYADVMSNEPYSLTPLWGEGAPTHTAPDGGGAPPATPPAGGAGGGGASHKMAVDSLPGPVPPGFKTFAANKFRRELTADEVGALWSKMTKEQRDFWANQRKENGGFR